MSTAARLGALEGLQRSVLSVRANWQLILLVWAQNILLMVLSLLALLPFVLVLELDLPAVGATPDESMDWMLRTSTEVLEQMTTPAFWLAMLSSSAVLMALMACYSFFQAGVFGVLVAADRRIPTGESSSVARLRAYDWRRFQEAGGRYLWPFFWQFNILMLVWLLWALVGALSLVLSGVVGGGAGLAAGIAFGCAAVLPLLFFFILMIFWGWFAQSAVVDGDKGAWAGLSTGFRVMVRRLGAVFLLFVIAAGIMIAVSMVFLVISLPLSLGLPPGGLQFSLTLVVQTVQWLVSAIFHLVLAGAIVAVFRGERVLEAESAVDQPG